MQRHPLNSILISGILGTAAMSILVYIAPAVGIPMGGPWKMLAGFFKVPIALGWILHFGIGVVLAGIYALAFVRILPGNRPVRGALYGIFPWLLAMVMVVPMMGGPLFMGSARMAFGSLLGHLVYGAVMGAFNPLPNGEA